MRGGGPGNSLPALLLREGQRIPYLMERIPELIFAPTTGKSGRRFHLELNKNTRVKNQGR